MEMKFNQSLLAACIAGMLLPVAAQASEADLLKKIEALAQQNALLAQQLQELKAQVQVNEHKTNQAVAAAAASKPAVAAANEETLAELQAQVKKLEDKSLSKWLSVSGDYRFRLDSLEGQSKTFTDVNATFANAQNQLQAKFLSDSTGPKEAPGMNSAMLTGLMNFAQGMNQVQTYDQATAFLGANAAMAGALGNFAKTVPAYKPENSSLMTNRFNLNLNAKATQDVTVTANLAMYKVFGANADSPVTNAGSAPFFADRVGVFDGTLGRVPSSGNLNVDRVYATWSNIADQEMWFSVGRRPATGGAPSHLKNNNPRPGNGGVPALLVDYAFDGMVLGYAPEIDALPGAYAKFCFGRGFESGYSSQLNSLADTDMMGISIVPIDTDPLRVWLQWNRGMNIFDAPTMSNTYFGNTTARTNLGDIDWYGIGFMSTFKRVGPGTLHVFGDVGMSVTHPNNNVSAQFGFQGLMTGSFFNPEAPTSKTGNAMALGLRYDLPSRTMFGLEYNRGSKDWITFAPAADDIWTAKLGTRGHVVDAYVMQELDRKSISSFFSKAFFRVGMQRYSFDYTGSNNWVGAPVAIGDVNGQLMTTTPLESATNLYATFEVKF